MENLEKPFNLASLLQKFMKKILILVAILLLALVISYFAIPEKLQISKVALLSSNKRKAYRCLTEENLLNKFLEKSTNDAKSDTGYAFTHNGISFLFRQRMFDLVEVGIVTGGDTLESFISLTELSPDSSSLVWSSSMEAASNPFTRMSNYWKGRKVHKSMSEKLDRYQQLVVNDDEVYGLKIERSQVTDSLLVTAKKTTTAFPSREEYYGLINKLQQYIAHSGAAPSNFPMLNISTADSTSFITTVAVPVNKVLPGNGEIAFKRMFPGNILITEVRGGVDAVEAGFSGLNNYVSDYQLVPPAISFQSLVTDRLVVKDSSQWITKLYFPVF